MYKLLYELAKLFSKRCSSGHMKTIAYVRIYKFSSSCSAVWVGGVGGLTDIYKLLTCTEYNKEAPVSNSVERRPLIVLPTPLPLLR